jgi:hypothetical protein
MTRCSILLFTLGCTTGAQIGANNGGGTDVEGNDLDWTDVTEDAGTGSNTLEVDGTITGEPIDVAAESLEELETDIEFDIFDANGNEVVGATVTLTSAAGEIVLEDCGGSYCGLQQGYGGAYTVDIQAGEDFVSGLVIAGPELHRLTGPDVEEMLDATQPLEIAWSPSGQAQITRIATNDFDIELEGDPGTYTLDAGLLESEPDAEIDEEIEIEREREVEPAGALPGSVVTVRVVNFWETTVAPTQP